MHKKSLLELTALQAKLTRKDEGDSKPSQASLLAEAKQLLGSCLGDALIRDALGHQEALRKRSEEYPSDDRILPTRLGNALRNFEDSAGAQYHLNAITAAPHLFLVGNSVHVQYVEDQAQTMDTSIRLCAISTLASVGAVAILITDGPWLFVALLPYILAYVAYRGAVSAARNYGIAIAALIDMNRFALYDAMHMRRPRDLAAEREQNELLMKLLKSEDVHMTYRPDTDNPSRLSSLRTKGSGRR